MRSKTVAFASALWIGALLVTGFPDAARACDEPGTPNQESARPASPTSVIVQWTNTAREGDVRDMFFDLEGRGTPSVNNVGPFRGPRGTVMSHQIGGLQTGRRVCYRIWARDGFNGCRSQQPSAWACATPAAGTTPPPAPPTPQPPTLSLTQPSANTFLITGHHFLPNTVVHLRIVDDALATIYINETAGPHGDFTASLGNLCRVSGYLHFSANDGRHNGNDATSTLWSNTVTGTCVVTGGRMIRKRALP